MLNRKQLLFFNKRKRYFVIVIFIILFLFVFPFIIFEVISQTRGLLNLSTLEKNIDNANNAERFMKDVNNYYEDFSLNQRILLAQLNALNKISNPDIYLNIKKIHIIKLIFDNSSSPPHELYQQLAEILFNMGYYQSSLHYLQYVNNKEELTKKERLHLFVMSYKIHTILGNFEYAISNANNILTLLPSDYEWTYRLAKNFMYASKYIQAKSELEKLVYDNGNNKLYFEAMFSLIEVLTKLELNNKVNFYYHYLVTVYNNLNKTDELLSAYAKYLTTKQSNIEAIEKWKELYALISKKKNINKNIKNNFEKYLRL